MKNRRYVIVLTVILLAVIAVFSWHGQRVKREQEYYIDEMNSKLRPVEKQIEVLENDIKELESDYRVRIKGIGTVILLFPTLDSRFYENNWPAVSGYGLNGVMALSMEQFPGKKGCITKKQFREVLRSGFSYCLAWDGKTDMDRWIDKMKVMLDEIGADMPDAIMIPSGKYKKSIDEDAARLGFTIVLHHGETGLDVIKTELPEEGKVWRLGVFDWGGRGANSIIDNIISNGGSIVLNDITNYAYRSVNLLQNLPKVKKEGKINISLITEAYEYYLTFDDVSSLLTAEMNEKKKKLQDKIEELKQQKEEIYEEYPWKW